MNDTGWLSKPAAERAADLARIRETVTAVSVSVPSPDGDLTVTVGPGGAVTAIDLTPRALRRDSAELSDVLIDALRQAGRAAHEQLTTRLAAITGGRGSTDVVEGSLPAAPAWQAIERSAPGGDDQRPLPGEAGHRLSTLLSTARTQLQRYEQLRDTLSTLSAAATSADGVATVTVGVGGAIQLIEVEPRALRSGPEPIGAAIVEALQLARAQAARLMAERTEELLGPRLDVRAMVETAIAEQLGREEA